MERGIKKNNQQIINISKGTWFLVVDYSFEYIK